MLHRKSTKVLIKFSEIQLNNEQTPFKLSKYKLFPLLLGNSTLQSELQLPLSYLQATIPNLMVFNT